MLKYLICTALLFPTVIQADVTDRLMETYKKQCDRIDADAAKKKQMLARSLVVKLQTQLRLETRKGNLDGALKIKKIIESLDASTSSLSYKAGVRCEKYLGKWSKMPDFSKLTPAKTEVRSLVELTSDEATKKTSFALVFNGYIKIPSDGIYTIKLGSDDGSILYVDGKKVIDSNRPQGMTYKTVQIKLSRGYHKFRVEYFNYVLIGKLALKVTGSGGPLKLRDILFYKKK